MNLPGSVPQNHPLIPNENTYLYVKKYLSIHSEDVNSNKYNHSEFEIETPQDYVNVSAVRLSSWSFPTNLNVFTISNINTILTFKFTDVYNPADHGLVSSLETAIYEGLIANINGEYIVQIEEGNYSPSQLSEELTNKFNETVTIYLNTFFNDNPAYAGVIPSFTSGYNQFVITYNEVSQTLWFGNKSCKFQITNESTIYDEKKYERSCLRKNELPDESNWGLPPLLGFNKKNIEANFSSDPGSDVNSTTVNGIVVPKFYYTSPGTWLLPTLTGASVYYLSCPNQVKLGGPDFMYMEIAGLNCLDETSPYNVSTFTTSTNKTNGVVNSSFAKIPTNSSSITQRWVGESMPYKWFYPANERIRKLKIKFRYHNGQLVDFNGLNYTFNLEFTILNAQNNRMITAVPPVL